MNTKLDQLNPSLTERDQQVIWHPYTQHKNMIPPIPIVKGDGALLFDEKNNAYIDAISSWWVNIHGHAHPYIAEKIYRQALQLDHVIFTGFTHEPAVQLAERLLPILPGNFSKVFYSDNGSTAVEVALKMAVQYWQNRATGNTASKTKHQKSKILAFRNSYHGDTFGAMSVSERGIFTLPFQQYLFEVVFIDTPTAENVDALQAQVRQHADEIACFIYEPLLQGAGGMLMYDAGLLDRLLTVVRENKIICIADEVLTGFGRTGKLFASEYLTLNKPDIICLSKGLTGGTMALSVTACTQDVFDAFVSDDRTKTFFHGHSFTANPIACASALASLDLLEKEGAMQRAENITLQNRAFVSKLISGGSSSGIKDLRQLGTIVAFAIPTGKDEYLNQLSAKITKQALQKGIYLRPLGNTVYMMPPYCITDEQLLQVYDFLIGLI